MPGTDARPEPLADQLDARRVVRSEVIHHVMVWDVVRETVNAVVTTALEALTA